jgi:hypothetical protein
MHADAPAISSGSDAGSTSIKRRKRVDGRTSAARRVKQLVVGYSARLGTVAADPTVSADILRLAETEVLCEDRRAAALRREPVDLAALNRLENTARRLRISLGLVGPPPPAPPMTLEEYERAKCGASS